MDEHISEFYKTVAENVRQKRLDCRKSLLEVAYEIGYSNDSFLSKLENNSEGKHFNLEQLYRIASYLECDICDFFKGVKYEHKPIEIK